MPETRYLCDLEKQGCAKGELSSVHSLILTQMQEGAYSD